MSSGLASLPLAHVWYDGKENTSWPTNPELSNGDRLNGSEAYAMILPYFTTNDMTPMDVHRLGWEQLKMLYPLVCVLQIWNQVLGEKDSLGGFFESFSRFFLELQLGLLVETINWSNWQASQFSANLPFHSLYTEKSFTMGDEHFE